MKKRYGLLLVVMAFVFAGCGSYYTLINQTPPTGDMRSYSVLSIGWLDLGQDKAKAYGFEGKDEGNWAALINQMNQKRLPEFLGQFVTGKTIQTAKSISEAPKKEGLIITFSDVIYNQRTSTGAQILFGSYAGSDTLDLTIHFIDAKTGDELSKSQVSIASKAGTGYSQWSFEGRLTNAIYNLARYISEKVV